MKAGDKLNPNTYRPSYYTSVSNGASYSAFAAENNWANLQRLYSTDLQIKVSSDTPIQQVCTNNDKCTKVPVSGTTKDGIWEIPLTLAESVSYGYDISIVAVTEDRD